MRPVFRILRKGVALFVDDGNLVVAVLIWIGICGMALPKVMPATFWQSLTFVLGLALILLESVWREARKDIR